MKPLFVFDLDSTITRCELLPLIARSMGLEDEMARQTEAAMGSELPFAQSFSRRVELLKEVPVSRARAIAAGAALNGEIARFLREYPQRCMILTGNLDVWIEDLVGRLGMRGRCLCSRALVREDRLEGIAEILDKAKACEGLPRPFVAIGDGSNDIGMLRRADLGIAFGGVRTLCEGMIAAADRVITDEKQLVSLLESLL